jgi:hypothetical protein
VATVRREVERVKVGDENHPAGTLLPRMRAVVEAGQALKADEPGARYAYRAALVDLAAVCEATASELPTPVTERGWNVGRLKVGPNQNHTTYVVRGSFARVVM